MSDGRGKTPKEEWEDAIALLEEENIKYAAIQNKESKPATKKKEKIEQLIQKVSELEPNKDEEPLSEGAKNYLLKFYAFEKYKKWRLTTGEELDGATKGTVIEGDSIDFLSKLDGVHYQKNEEHFSNEFIRGVPDIILRDESNTIQHVIDAKSPYDIEKFISNLGKELNPSYWWQMQGYLALTGAPHGEMSFCLVSVPPDLIKSRYEQLLGSFRNYTIEELTANLTFDDIPPIERRIRVEVLRDDEAIQKVYRRIVKCREYLSEIEKMHTGTI